MYNERKVNIQKLLKTFFTMHQESSILKTRARRYGRNIEHRASEISFGQITSPE
jgi:hypothetical protein